MGLLYCAGTFPSALMLRRGGRLLAAAEADFPSLPSKLLPYFCAASWSICHAPEQLHMPSWRTVPCEHGRLGTRCLAGRQV